MIRRRIATGLAVLTLFAFAGAALAQETAADEALLKSGGIGSDADALVAFIRKLSPGEAEHKKIAGLIRQLGDDDFSKRQAASRELVSWGPVAVEALRTATRDGDAEIAYRASACLADIERGPALHMPCAAIRLIAVRKPPSAIPDLLRYLGHTSDADAHEAVLDALATLAPKASPADDALKTALKDTLALRRGAAGYVLGRSTDADIRGLVQPLLNDPSIDVRWRTVQGLLAGQDRAAMPALLALTLEDNKEIGYQVDDLLGRLAGDAHPELPTGDDAATRQKRHDVWARWWKDNGDKVDLARLNEADRFLNRTLVPEMHAGKVWEFDRAGKVLWELKADLQGPIDAQVLPNGHILIAEINGKRVTERDRTGKVVWKKEVQTPIACQRFNVNMTFIGTNRQLMVVNADGKEAWSYNAPAGFFIHSVQRTRTGHFVMVSTAGVIKEIDAKGKELRSINVPVQGSWNGIEAVGNDRYLISGSSIVAEVDSAGKLVWQCQVAGANYAQRLPNGNTFVVSGSRGLLEVDKTGKVVSEKKMTSSVWRAHRR